MIIFNIKQRYYNLQIKKNNIQKTAFLTDLELYEWLIALKELKRLPAEFTCYITYILQEYLNNFIAVYFDNIIVYLKNLKEHNQHIQFVIEKLIKAKLTFKIKKCKFDII